jgi:hypothetical protein
VNGSPTPTGGRIILDFPYGRIPACVENGLNLVPVEWWERRIPWEGVRMAPPDVCAFLKGEVNWVSGQAQSKRPWTRR